MEDMVLEREDITESVIVIRISRSYREDVSRDELYDMTRGYWKVDRTKAGRAEYAFSVYGGIVKEVYEIEKWLPAGTVPRRTLPDAEVPEGRYEFVGKVAEGVVRDKYVEKSIAHLYQKGEANPIKYFLDIKP